MKVMQNDVKPSFPLVILKDEVRFCVLLDWAFLRSHLLDYGWPKAGEACC